MIRASPEIGRTRHVVVKSRRVSAGASWAGVIAISWVGSFMGPLFWFLPLLVLMPPALLPRALLRSGAERYPPALDPSPAVPAARPRPAGAEGLLLPE